MNQREMGPHEKWAAPPPSLSNIIEANIRAAVGVNNPTAMAEDEAEIDA